MVKYRTTIDGLWICPVCKEVYYHKTEAMKCYNDHVQQISFTCPACGGHKLEEVLENATVSSLVLDLCIQGDIANCDYGKPTIEDGEVVRYQCFDCGYILSVEEEDVDSLQELASWLLKHSPKTLE